MTVVIHGQTNHTLLLQIFLLLQPIAKAAEPRSAKDAFLRALLSSQVTSASAGLGSPRALRARRRLPPAGMGP